jgi:hypothetical protein
MSHPLPYILSTMFLKAFILHSSLNLTPIEDSKICTSTTLISPSVLQDVDAPRIQENWHLELPWLSAPGTRHIFPQETSIYSFLLESESTPD